MYSSGRTLTGDKTDKFADTLLHAFLRFFGYLGVFWERIFHDPGHWRKVSYVSIVKIIFVGLGG